MKNGSDQPSKPLNGQAQQIPDLQQAREAGQSSREQQADTGKGDHTEISLSRDQGYKPSNASDADSKNTHSNNPGKQSG